MKQVRQACSIVVFILFLSLPVLAGDMDFPKLPPPPPATVMTATATETSQPADETAVLETMTESALQIAGSILAIF